MGTINAWVLVAEREREREGEGDKTESITVFVTGALVSQVNFITSLSTPVSLSLSLSLGIEV